MKRLTVFPAVQSGLFAITVLVPLGPSVLRAQAFDCVLLNDDNTNIFLTPDDCFNLPQNAVWCNCVRSLFANPVKGELSGFNQAVQWIVDQPGIGNHRVEVDTGTLDLSAVQVGDVIGHTEINELIPESVGVPPGTFFVVRSDVRVTAASGSSVEFEVLITEISRPWVELILEYDPTDEDHSSGLFYQGRLTSRGEGEGFVLEYRYPKERVVLDDPGTPEDEAHHAAIEVGDSADPGFTVRYLISFFTTESGIYTLPVEETIDITTTLRRFGEPQEGTLDTLDEILDLGTEDLCVVREDPVADQDPCKTIEEVLQIKNKLGENSPPTASIVMVDPETSFQLLDPAEVFTLCGSARLIFRGGNSDDGDGGLQELSYEWFVISGPDGGAVIPEATRLFKDTEITFTVAETYEIGLRVDDGGGENHQDETSVTVFVNDAFDVNQPPLAVITTQPDPPEVELVGGQASVILDGSQSLNGFGEKDDCMQELSFEWEQVFGPAGSTIESPREAVTLVRFSVPGTYTMELTVDDGADEDNLDSAQVEVTVTGSVPFRRGDVDANGQLEITDPINLLNHLFLGGQAPPCPDAADSNDEGALSITSAVFVLNFLFLGGPPPPDPGPTDCGPDPSDDILGECVYEC